MNRLELFKKALIRTQELFRRYPYMMPLKSIEAQLNYLIELEEGKNTDKSRLKDIIIGILAVREVENTDQELAEMLHKTQGEVDKMNKS